MSQSKVFLYAVLMLATTGCRSAWGSECRDPELRSVLRLVYAHAENATRQFVVQRDLSFELGEELENVSDITERAAIVAGTGAMVLGGIMGRYLGYHGYVAISGSVPRGFGGALAAVVIGGGTGMLIGGTASAVGLPVAILSRTPVAESDGQVLRMPLLGTGDVKSAVSQYFARFGIERDALARQESRKLREIGDGWSIAGRANIAYYDVLATTAFSKALSFQRELEASLQVRNAVMAMCDLTAGTNESAK